MLPLRQLNYCGLTLLSVLPRLSGCYPSASFTAATVASTVGPVLVKRPDGGSFIDERSFSLPYASLLGPRAEHKFADNEQVTKNSETLGYAVTTPTPPKDASYYNHSQQALIPSLGTYYDGLRIPDLLLTLRYRLNPKTHKLSEDILLDLQVDGPNTAQFDFPRDMTIITYDHKGGCKFDLDADFVFRPLNTPRASTVSPVMRIFLHARLYGTFNSQAPRHRLHVGGAIVGAPANRRAR